MTTTRDTQPAPAPRVLEDLAEAGRRALRRGARDEGDRLTEIDRAADWLLDRAREIRESGS